MFIDKLPFLSSTRWIAAFLCLFASSLAFAEDVESPSDKKEKEEAKPKTFSLSGVFEAADTKEVALKTEHLTSMEIKRLVDHGKTVSKGQTVVWFQTKDIDEKIEAADTELSLAKLKLDDEEFSYKQFLETQKLDRAAAQRARKNAQQDYDNFVQVDRERQRLSAEFSLKSSKASLDNAAEELKQLEQMYKEDDLTEESEEIVLKRAKQNVEFAEFRLKGTEISTERTVKQSIPRSEASQEDTLARAQATYKKAMHDLDTARQRRDIEITRSREKFQKQENELKEMRAERKHVVLNSPIDGFVIHGKLNRGKLSDKPSTMKEGTKVTPEQVILTVANPSQLQVRIDLSEKDLSKVAVGDKCQITAKAFPEQSFKGQVKSIGAFPYVAGKYDCIVTLRRGKKQPNVLPTMACDVEFTAKDSEK